MNDIEELVILLNNRCNLRCTYCTFREDEVEGFVTCDTARVHKTLDLFFDRVRRRPQAPRIVCFNADGEALLARGALLDAVAHAARRRAALDARNVLIALVTNGTLVDRALALELARLDVVVTVSIDGGAAVHDRHRVGPGGDGTHQDVLAGIAELRRAGIPLSLRAVVSPDTAPHLSESYRALQALGPARPVKLRPARLPGERMPGAWVERFTTHYLGCVEELLAEPDFPLAELPDDAYHFARYALTGQGREAYCAAGHAMLWLTPTGHFTACGLFSRGEEWLGHVDEVSSAEELRGLLARPLARRLREDAPPTRAPCLSCRWLPVCRGGCPALTALPGTPETPPLCAFYTSLGETLERLLVPRAGAEFAPRRAFDV